MPALGGFEIVAELTVGVLDQIFKSAWDNGIVPHSHNVPAGTAFGPYAAGRRGGQHPARGPGADDGPCGQWRATRPGGRRPGPCRQPAGAQRVAVRPGRGHPRADVHRRAARHDPGGRDAQRRGAVRRQRHPHHGRPDSAPHAGADRRVRARALRRRHHPRHVQPERGVIGWIHRRCVRRNLRRRQQPGAAHRRVAAGPRQGQAEPARAPAHEQPERAGRPAAAVADGRDRAHRDHGRSGLGARFDHGPLQRRHRGSRELRPGQRRGRHQLQHQQVWRIHPRHRPRSPAEGTDRVPRPGHRGRAGRPCGGGAHGGDDRELHRRPGARGHRRPRQRRAVDPHAAAGRRGLGHRRQAAGPGRRDRLLPEQPCRQHRGHRQLHPRRPQLRHCPRRREGAADHPPADRQARKRRRVRRPAAHLPEHRRSRCAVDAAGAFAAQRLHPPGGRRHRHRRHRRQHRRRRQLRGRSRPAVGGQPRWRADDQALRHQPGRRPVVAGLDHQLPARLHHLRPGRRHRRPWWCWPSSKASPRRSAAP